MSNLVIPGSWLYRALIVLLLGFLVLPILIVFVASLTSTPYPAFPPPSLSLRWFAKALRLGWFRSSLKTSLVLAFASTTGTVVLGVIAARVLSRSQFPGRDFLEFFFLSPLIIPPVVLGFALLLFFVTLHLRQPLLNLFLGHLLVTLPYMIRSVWSNMAGLDPSLEEAAQTLGATPFTAFRRVTLPLIRPGVMAGFVLAFTYSFNNVTISIFLTGPGVSTLPVEMVSYVAYSADPTLAAISSVMVLVALAFFLLVERTVGTGIFVRQ